LLEWEPGLQTREKFPTIHRVERIFPGVGTSFQRRWFEINKLSIIPLLGKGRVPFTGSQYSGIGYQRLNVNRAAASQVGPQTPDSLLGMAGDARKPFERHWARW
jgi:hypothetical protein